DEETDVNDDSEETKFDNDGNYLTHPNLSTYKADDEEEEEQKTDDDEVSSDQRVYSPPDYQLTDEEENQKGDDEAISLILGIVDTYLASKMKDAVDVVVQLQTKKIKEEAQAENHDFLNQSSCFPLDIPGLPTV
nr:hypothetical protein [Tanacetum cinerariifolium]